MTVEPLTALDTSFLCAERPGAPVHVGAVATLEAAPLLDAAGRFRIDDVRRLVDARLAALPRLRRRLAWPPLGLGRPCWIDDDRFDVAEHVDVVELPPGSGDDDLRRLAEGLFARALDRRRPLWHVRFVTGLSGGRVGLVQRVHHALVDGVSGVDVALALFDVTPEPASPPPAPDRDGGAAMTITLPGLRAALASPAATVRSVAAAARHPGRLARQAVDAGRGLAALLEKGVTAPPSSLNVPIGDERRLAWVRTGLDAVKATGRRHGASVNDVVLAAVAAGARDLLLGRGEAIPVGAAWRTLVPVSRRAAGERGTLGNRVTGLALDLPIGIGDPVRRLQAVSAATAKLKSSREADGVEALIGALDLLPAAVLDVARPLVERQTVFNTVVTNVPGTPVPLYLLGARMLEAMPFVPLAGNLSLGVAVLSYDGALTIAATADSATCPDVDVFAAGVESGLAALGVGLRAEVA